jgi:hypothetical protein
VIAGGVVRYNLEETAARLKATWGGRLTENEVDMMARFGGGTKPTKPSTWRVIQSLAGVSDLYVKSEKQIFKAVMQTLGLKKKETAPDVEAWAIPGENFLVVRSVKGRAPELAAPDQNAMHKAHAFIPKWDAAVAKAKSGS